MLLCFQKLERSVASDFTNTYFKTNHTNRIIGMVEKDRNRDVGNYLELHLKCL